MNKIHCTISILSLFNLWIFLSIFNFKIYSVFFYCKKFAGLGLQNYGLDKQQVYKISNFQTFTIRT